MIVVIFNSKLLNRARREVKTRDNAKCCVFMLDILQRSTQHSDLPLFETKHVPMANWKSRQQHSESRARGQARTHKGAKYKVGKAVGDWRRSPAVHFTLACQLTWSTMEITVHNASCFPISIATFLKFDYLKANVMSPWTFLARWKVLYRSDGSGAAGRRAELCCSFFQL